MTPRQKGRQQPEHGDLPPRQKQAEVIQDSYMMAERFKRAFWQLLQESRNQRRMFANLILATDTVNIADGGPQQVNVSSGVGQDGKRGGKPFFTNIFRLGASHPPNKDGVPKLSGLPPARADARAAS